MVEPLEGCQVDDGFDLDFVVERVPFVNQDLLQDLESTHTVGTRLHDLWWDLAPKDLSGPAQTLNCATAPPMFVDRSATVPDLEIDDVLAERVVSVNLWTPVWRDLFGTCHVDASPSFSCIAVATVMVAKASFMLWFAEHGK